jgi:hypothetical protein
VKQDNEGFELVATVEGYESCSVRLFYLFELLLMCYLVCCPWRSETKIGLLKIIIIIEKQKSCIMSFHLFLKSICVFATDDTHHTSLSQFAGLPLLWENLETWKSKGNKKWSEKSRVLIKKSGKGQGFFSVSLTVSKQTKKKRR